MERIGKIMTEHCFVFNCISQVFGRLRVVFADSAYGRNGLPAWV